MALLPRLLSLAGRPALGRALVVLNFFYFRTMEATVDLGTFNAGEMFWYTSPDLCLDTILSRSSTDNSFDLMAWFLRWHALSTVCYVDVCAFPNHQITTGGLQSSCRNIKGDQWKQDLNFKSKTKGLNTYVNKVSVFYLQTFLKTRFHVVIMGYCV